MKYRFSVAVIHEIPLNIDSYERFACYAANISVLIILSSVRRQFSFDRIFAVAMVPASITTADFRFGRLLAVAMDPATITTANF